MTSENTQKFNPAATSACIGMLLFWSSGPIFIKLLTNYLDLWTQNFLRYTVACLFWLPFLLFLIKTKKLDPKIWRLALLPAAANIIMQSLWAGAFYYIDPAFMNLVAKSSVIWIVGCSLIFFPDERRLAKSKCFWLGLIFSAAGVIGVCFFEETFASKTTIIGIVTVLLAAFFWSVYTIAVKINFRHIDSRISFSVISIYTAAGLSILAFLFGRPQDCLSLTARPWLYVVISAILCIALAHVLYYAAIKRIGATIPSLVMLASPFTVLAISSVVFNESLASLQYIFGVVLLVGSGLAIWSQKHLR